MLTDVLNSFINAFALRSTALTGHANGLLRIFILIELALFGIYFALEGGELLTSLFKKFIVIGAFQFLVSEYRLIVDTLRDSFVAIGLATDAGPTHFTAEMLDPSAVMSLGLDAVAPVLENFTVWSVLTPSLVFLQFICMVAILVAFSLMALQIFITLLEFYITSTLAIILIPFGLFKPTAFLADKAIGAIFTASIKLMVLAFVSSAAQPVIKGLTFTSNDPTIRQSWTLLIGVFAVALVLKKAPSIAVSLVSGSSNLDLGPLVQPLRNAARAASSTASGVATGGAAAIGAVGKAATVAAESWTAGKAAYNGVAAAASTGSSSGNSDKNDKTGAAASASNSSSSSSAEQSGAAASKSSSNSSSSAKQDKK